MENKTTSAGYFDQTLTTGEIQKLKTAIPYVDASMQKFLAIYVKFLELMYTISFFGENSLKPPAQETDAPFLNMLTEMKEFCDDSEKKNIDGMLSMFKAFQMYQKYQDLFKGLDLSALMPGDGTPDLSSFFSKGGAPDLSSLFSGGGTPDLSSLFSDGETPDLSSLFSKGGTPDPSSFSGDGSSDPSSSTAQSPGAAAAGPADFVPPDAGNSPGSPDPAIFAESQKNTGIPGSSGIDMLRGMLDPEQLSLYEKYLNSP